MKKSNAILTILLTVGGLASAFAWVPSAINTSRDFMIEPAIDAIDTLAVQHTKDMHSMGVQVATSLHRAIESAEVRTRIVKYELEIIKLERDLRRAVTAADRDSIKRSIERLEKSIDRELDEQTKLKGLTQTQIASLIGSESS